MKISSLVASGVLPLLAIGTPTFAFEPIFSQGGGHVAIHPVGASFVPEGGTDDLLATLAQTGGQFSVMTLSNFAGESSGFAVVDPDEAKAWYVVEGTYEFHVGDQIVTGAPGTFVAVDAGQPHGYVATTAGVLLVILEPTNLAAGG